MEAKAVLKYTRISPRKVEIVLDLIRNKPVDLAMAILKHTPKAACEDLDRKRRKQLQHGQKQPLCFRVLRLPGSDAQENPPESSGKSLQNFEENLSCHTRCEREGISEEVT